MTIYDAYTITEHKVPRRASYGSIQAIISRSGHTYERLDDGDDDVCSNIETFILKWNWTGNVARMDDSRWTKLITEWKPRQDQRPPTIEPKTYDAYMQTGDKVPRRESYGRIQARNMFRSGLTSDDNRWTKLITEWRPSQDAFRSQGRPPTIWADDLRRIHTKWRQSEKEKGLWKDSSENFVRNGQTYALIDDNDVCSNTETSFKSGTGLDML